jgi:nucleoside recognition membrane protein YjiH
VIAMTSPAPIRRGVALTSLLTLLTLAQGLLLVLTLQALGDAAGHGADVGPLGLFALLVVVLALVGLGGVLAWRRWGVVLFAVDAAIGLVADLAAGLGPLLLVRVALLGGLFWAVSVRWERFE